MNAAPPPSHRWPKWLAVFLLVAASFALLINVNPTLGDPMGCLMAQGSCPDLAAEPHGHSPASPIAPVTYRFAALGDWGAGTPFQKDVARQMALAYQKTPFDSVLMLGDNIYPDGNIKKHAQAYFTDMYRPLIEAGVHFIVALGNHDVLRGFEKDQIRFFKMPGAYYVARPSTPEVAFFVLNTNTFAKDRVQQQWLDKQLRECRAAWKIVVGHHPVYSSGEHGNNGRLQATLTPLMLKYGVAFYLAGHDHEYERFQPVKGVQYIVSGGGGAYLRDFKKPVAGSLKREKRNHFLLFTLTGHTMEMQAIDKHGEVFDTAQWVRPPRAQALPEAS